MKLILSSILLGFGGFDPVGAVLIMAALANGTKKKQVYLFSLMALLSTVVFGLIFSYGTSISLNYFIDIMNHIPDMAYVFTGFLISIVCVAWFIRSTLLKGNKERVDDQKESKFMKFAKRSMPLVGFIFGFWAMSDPTFGSGCTKCKRGEYTINNIMFNNLDVVRTDSFIYFSSIINI